MKTAVTCLGLLAAMAFSARSFASPASSRSTCNHSYCVFVKYDENLMEESKSLVETLRLRLCKEGVQIPDPVLSFEMAAEPTGAESEATQETLEDVVTGDVEEIPPEPDVAFESAGCPEPFEETTSPNPKWWVVHINRLSNQKILLAVDYMEAESGEDLIREFDVGPNTDSTAWTLALTIEEVVVPYLKEPEETAPLGAGLALIEPAAVTGVKKKQNESPDLPILRYTSLGLDMAYLGLSNQYLNDFIVGPKLALQGLLGPRFVVLFGAGWMGTGDVDTTIPWDHSVRVTGTASHMPLDLLFGYCILRKPRLSTALLGGVSAGFAFYKFESNISDRSKNYLYFDPWIQAKLEISLHIYGPLAVYFNAGVAFPLLRDVFEENIADYEDVKVYSQDWMIPLFSIGVQLWNVKIF